MEPKDQTNKFSEISPVLELIYVMLTNMNKYLQVYANDISAEKLQQYLDAKNALEVALKKFDDLYGLDSSASEMDEDGDRQERSDVQNDQNSKDFDSATDPESLKKAKEAVAELKSLFNEMKQNEESESEVSKTDLPPIAEDKKAPSVQNIPSISSSDDNESNSQKSQITPPPVSQEDSSANAEMPSPMNTQEPTKKEAPVKEEKPAQQPRVQQDAAEIDSILAELRKLQNKGNSEL